MFTKIKKFIVDTWNEAEIERKNTIVENNIQQCPICLNELNIFNKSSAKFRNDYICTSCCSKLKRKRIPAGRVFLLEDLRRFIGVKIPEEKLNVVPYEAYCDAYITRKQKGIPRDYVVFDTETTGLDLSTDNIIEISAIKYINNKKVDEFSCLVNPNRTLDTFITKLTGIKQSDLNDKPTIEKIIPDFFNFIEDLTLVAHNAPYDIKMLACECYRNNIKLCDNKIIDTVTLAKRIIPRERVNDYKLTTLKEYLGLNFKSHRALDDCETCARVYQLYLASTQKKKIVMLDEETGEILEELN